ncbi:MAG TPA: hypothetical protein VFM35_11070 [Candidatus Binatia bacterium]|nr:hypothetical protein [Candidatus Binatia bacterium]
MNRTKRHILSLILVIGLLAIPTLTVFAKELGLLTISGPGIKGEVTLKDPDQMMKLEQSGFFDQASFMKAPENPGQGYSITAHLNLDGKIVPFVEMVYYPAEEGKPGFVHYRGRLNGESMQKVDQWGTLRLEADTAFRGLMAANNITLQPAIAAAPAAVEPAAPVVEPVTAPNIPTTPAPAPYLVPALVALTLVLLGAGLVLRRRAASHPSL